MVEYNHILNAMQTTIDGGSIIHYTQSEHFATTGTWTPESATGLWGLFSFNFLSGTAATPSEAIYTLPIPEDGTYEISLLYRPDNDRASNTPITIAHADGTSELTWNMREGSNHEWIFIPPPQRPAQRNADLQSNHIPPRTFRLDSRVIRD